MRCFHFLVFDLFFRYYFLLVLPAAFAFGASAGADSTKRPALDGRGGVVGKSAFLNSNAYLSLVWSSIMHMSAF
jgi:hypothetical protein|tara:strand:+ start:205 stop:426 length:222 start_codon:yes stop_codon:yes gene_type:complete